MTQHHTSSFEKQVDSKMDALMKKGFVEKFMHNNIISQIMHSSVMMQIDKALRPYFKTICTVIGWIAIVTGVLGLLGSLLGVGSFGMMTYWHAGTGMMLTIYMVLGVVSSVLSILVGRGLIKFKKRTLSVLLIVFLIACVMFIRGLIMTGRGRGIVSLLLEFVFLLLALRNKDLFVH